MLSTGFIVGGLVISRRGLGRNPLRSMLLANVIIWMITSVFAVRSSILLLAVGMYLYLCVVPFVEAAEQTVCRRWCRSNGRAGCSGSHRASSRPRRR